MDGIRYVDDIVIIGSYVAHDIIDKRHTDRLIDDFIRCYEEDEIKNDQFVFLEGDISISESVNILTKHVNIILLVLNKYMKSSPILAILVASYYAYMFFSNLSTRKG